MGVGRGGRRRPERKLAAALEGMVGVGEEAADDGGDSLRLVGKGGEDDAGLEGDGVKSLESQGDKIMEGAEAAGDRDYARDYFNQALKDLK